jgi:hypothetical protein
MADQAANVQFGGDATGAVEAARKAAEAVKASVEQMKLSMEKLNSQFEYVTKGFKAISAAVAGGSALKEFVSAAVDVTKQAQSMGKSLGVSATDASVFKSALNEVGVSGDLVAMAGKRVTMALSQGGEKFAALGVQTRDANGEFRNSRDIMLDVNEKLRGFKEGTDRNIESMKIYGRSYADLAPFINKFTADLEGEELAHAGLKKEQLEGLSASERYAVIQDYLKQRAMALNLVVGQESVDAVRAYGIAQRGMKEVFEGVERTIGEALLPRLTDLGKWFNSIGPTAVSMMRGIMETYLVLQDTVKESAISMGQELFRMFELVGGAIRKAFGQDSEGISGMQIFANALTALAVLMVSFGGVARETFEVVGSMVMYGISGLMSYGRVLERVMHLDFKGAIKAFAEGVLERENIVKDSNARLLAMNAETAERLKLLLEGNPTAAKKFTDAKPPKSDGESSTGGKEKKDGRAGLLKAQLDADLAVQKEAAAEVLRVLEDQHAKELLSDRQFYAAKVTMEQEGIDREADAKKAELAQVQVDMGKKVNAELGKQNALKAQAAKIEGELTVLSLKRLDAAAAGERALTDAEEKRNTKLAEARIASNRKLADLDIAAQEESLSQSKQMGEITAAQELTQQRALLDAKYAAEMQELAERLALVKYDQAARMKIMDDMAAAAKTYDNNVAKNANSVALEAAKPFLSMRDSMASAFQQGLDGMFDKSKSFGAKMKALWVGLSTAFVQEMVTKKVAKWAAGETAQTAATLAGTAERTAAEWWASAQSVAATAWAAVKNIATYAYEAAAAAFKAVAGIPVVGPYLAVGAAAAALVAVGAFASHIASAEGGYDIPAGVNPITQLHEREMVLPAKQADVIRSMADSGGSGGGPTVNYHDHSGRLSRQQIRENASAIADELGRLNRNFYRPRSS